jgi:predicted nucleic acid-binding protein
MESIHFISTENKALIWQLLMEMNAFINIPDHYFSKVKSLYEEIINEVNEKSKNSNLSLKERNKIVISKMIDTIKFYNKEHIQKPLEEVKIRVEEQYNNRKEEFIKLVNHNKPKDISFNEESDKPFNTEELNSKLNSMITSRSYDLQASQPPPPSSPTVTVNREEVEKKVNFVPTTNDILNKLKKVDSKKNDDSSISTDKLSQIYDLLKMISQNQDTIIGLLKN